VPYILTFGITLGSTDIGLTSDLRAQLMDTEAAPVGAAISTGFVEVGGGNYMLTCSIPSGHKGGIKFYNQSTDDILAFAAINPEDDEYKALIKAKTDTLGAGKVQVNSPVTPSGDATIYAGYDMTAANGLALDFLDPGDWPDLTGAQVTFAARNHDIFTLQGVVLDPGGANQIARFEPLAVDTAGLFESDKWFFDVYALLTTLELRPLVKDGRLNVTKKLDIPPE
jgi:hypothetical protein